MLGEHVTSQILESNVFANSAEPSVCTIVLQFHSLLTIIVYWASWYDYRWKLQRHIAIPQLSPIDNRLEKGAQIQISRLGSMFGAQFAVRLGPRVVGGSNQRPCARIKRWTMMMCGCRRLNHDCQLMLFYVSRLSQLFWAPAKGSEDFWWIFGFPGWMFWVKIKGGWWWVLYCIGISLVVNLQWWRSDWAY